MEVQCYLLITAFSTVDVNSQVLIQATQTVKFLRLRSVMHSFVAVGENDYYNFYNY